MNNRASLAAVILTFNEAQNVRHCLESIKGLCDIHVVDSGSTDGTVGICREYTQHIHHHEYRNHSSQWQWALDNLPLHCDWVLTLDADFVVTAELRRRLEEELPSLPASVSGIYIRHLYMFGGSLIRFGGTKQFWLRIVRRGSARADLSDLVDFRFIVEGEARRWREAVIEYNRHDDDISTWIRKQDKFALRLAVEEELRRAGVHQWQIRPQLFGSTDQRFAWLRDRWLVMPLWLRPVVYFMYRYFLAGGFLDGRGGFLYHSLQGFWLRLLVDWKISELRAAAVSGDTLRAFSECMLETKSGSVREVVDKLEAEKRGPESMRGKLHA
jgi:glycosyltransferase involved in cell wall biosynthesis